MQVEQVCWLAEEGITRYDLGPVMDYKTHWTEQQFEIETWAMIKMA
jgi:CelD/BcsL family acetyltransferase involved in cellulose biosynthesis